MSDELEAICPLGSSEAIACQPHSVDTNGFNPDTKLPYRCTTGHIYADLSRQHECCFGEFCSAIQNSQRGRFETCLFVLICTQELTGSLFQVMLSDIQTITFVEMLSTNVV